MACAHWPSWRRRDCSPRSSPNRCRLLPRPPDVRLTLMTRQGPGALDALTQGERGARHHPNPTVSQSPLFQSRRCTTRNRPRPAGVQPAGAAAAHRARRPVKYPLILPEVDNHPWHQNACCKSFAKAAARPVAGRPLRRNKYPGPQVRQPRSWAVALPAGREQHCVPHVVTRFLGAPFPSMALLLLWAPRRRLTEAGIAFAD